MVDVSAIIIFHNEDLLAGFSIQSLIQGVKFARDAGVKVEVSAIVDKPSAETKAVVDSYEDHFDHIHVVAFGDLGSSRNFGREQSKGKYVTFFDGDDLWGEEWILRAFKKAESDGRANQIYHPELIHYFNADDYLAQSSTKTPNASAKGYFFIQVDSNAATFDPRTIFFNNLWTANSFALREIYDTIPYVHVDRSKGFGVEDWTWNGVTLAKGYDHAIVRDTVHCIRIRRSGSLSQQNVKEKLLPPLYELADEIDRL
jgi:glycosyltransferase involved in cell wall biosynthesis